MNVQLHKVLSGRHPGSPAMAILRAIPSRWIATHHIWPSWLGPRREGEQGNPCQKPWKEHGAAHHLFSLRQAVETYDFYGERLKECDACIDEQLRKMSPTGRSSPQGGGRHLKAPQEPAQLRSSDAHHRSPGGSIRRFIDGFWTAMTVGHPCSPSSARTCRVFATEKHFKLVHGFVARTTRLQEAASKRGRDQESSQPICHRASGLPLKAFIIARVRWEASLGG